MKKPIALLFLTVSFSSLFASAADVPMTKYCTQNKDTMGYEIGFDETKIYLKFYPLDRPPVSGERLFSQKVHLDKEGLTKKLNAMPRFDHSVYFTLFGVPEETNYLEETEIAYPHTKTTFVVFSILTYLDEKGTKRTAMTGMEYRNSDSKLLRMSTDLKPEYCK